jgi:UDP-2-acetamido-2,6-beta-L-arabino-hexul-4-ose reductase
MRILVTGSNGFIGKNLVMHLKERDDIEVICFNKDSSIDELSDAIKDVNYIFHLAGINRPKNTSEFKIGNIDFTKVLVKKLEEAGSHASIIYTSSIQADLDNDYGASKKEAESILLKLNNESKTQVGIYRLPNVFGKWAKPNYNSAVATFCFNIANDLPIQINDPQNIIKLIYIDDLIEQFLKIIDEEIQLSSFINLEKTYEISVGDLGKQLYKFKDSRANLISEEVGQGLTRALYSTYLSYFPKNNFSYPVPQYKDERGVFVEMLKTSTSGQFSFFTAHPGITRGEHYHHTKTEKFLVIKGHASFKFRHMISGDYHEILIDGEKSEIVETVPGWTHNIKNIGDTELVVMLWANEIFDRDKPDTYANLVTGKSK